MQIVQSKIINKVINELETGTYNFVEDTWGVDSKKQILLSQINYQSKEDYVIFDGKIVIDKFESLFNTFVGWKILSDFYHLDLPLELNSTFHSLYILHGKIDEHPSAGFCRGNNGAIVYNDFAIGRTYTLPEVYHALKTNEVPLINDLTLRKKLLSQWTAEFMNELNIYTQDAIDYQSSLQTFIDLAIKNFKIPERFEKAWRVIANKMVRVYDYHGDIFTARWLAKEAGIRDHLIANKALNLLIACGVLKKGENKVLKNGETQIIKPVNGFNVYKSLETLSLIQKDLHKRNCSWDKFSRRAVIDVLDVKVANNIFTRDRGSTKNTKISQQGDDKSKEEIVDVKETQTDNKRESLSEQ